MTMTMALIKAVSLSESQIWTHGCTSADPEPCCCRKLSSPVLVRLEVRGSSCWISWYIDRSERPPPERLWSTCRCRSARALQESERFASPLMCFAASCLA